MGDAAAGTNITGENSRHEGLDVVLNDFPVGGIEGFHLDQFVQLVIGVAVADFIEVDGFLSTGDKTGKSVPIL